ncbi:myb-binding protein 1A-like protein [Copidosoma floridanum]|uniref:myb-binding protein 1A-like protein n=1 Tax=Copidosoma floridanum TaxID=29053 RepID=UPI0006C97F5E|nr:myb-binding protein 1A-like protein [Copidosoma floridanum]
MAAETLDCFPKLLHENTNSRIDGGVKLIEQLSRVIQENNEESKEFYYALNRLVRGLGSSKVNARKGFYATLTVLLKMNPTITVDQIFSAMDKELVATGSSSKGEHSDVCHGRVLACGALIRSKVLKSCPIEEQKKVLECLIQNGKQKDYLYFECILFIGDFLKQIDDNGAMAALWPVMEQETCKPLSEQNLDSLHLLLIVFNTFPDVINKETLKNSFGSDKVICKDTVKEIAKILMKTPRTVYKKHPVHQLFCEILTSKGKPELVIKFWEAIDECFDSQTHKLIKTEKYMAVELFHLLIENHGKYVASMKDKDPADKKKHPKNEAKSFFPSLLSTNFLKYFLKRFKTNPIKNDEIAMDFQKALTLFVKVLDQDLEFQVQNSLINKDEESKLRISIIKKLIMFPGDLMIEKLTGTKVFQILFQKLNANGIEELSDLFREIAANTKFKEKPDCEPEPWRFEERIYAMQIFSVKLMNHSEMMNNHDWRLEQLKFLFNLGLCETNVEQELLSPFKECFYRALDHKFPKLDDLRNILKSLIAYIDKAVFKEGEIKLKKPLKEKAEEAWEKMLKLNKKLEKDVKSTEKISAVFHTINLQMGLQLFFEPRMAKEAIDDICSSFEHLKATDKINNKIDNEKNDEPLWVEVVVDLLLLLLSRKSHLLRSLVGCVFPHICPHLTSVAVHSILETLDPNKNPLVSKDDEYSKSDSSDDEDKSDNENENNEDEEEDEENEDEKDDETTEAESDSDLEESGSEDETTTDLLRMSIQKILYNDASQSEENDIDVDNIDEDEGKRLDAQLAAAFKMVKQTRKSSSKKQKEGDQVLMHYRIRVMDLLEMYMESGPSMSLALDMLVPVFQLLEFCIKDPHQKPLENRVRACMKKLAATKKFESVEDVDENVLITTLQVMIQESKLTASVSKEMGDKLADCCVFLIRCSQLANCSTGEFIKIFVQYLTSFFEKRSCIIQPILFKRLLQLNWVGTWKLAPVLVKFSFDQNIRSYRRGQALEFLRTFYSNKMINLEDSKDKKLKLEKNLCQKSIELFKSNEPLKEEDEKNEEAASDVGKEIKQKYVSHLLTLLFAVHTHHVPEAWDWTEVGKAMASYRAKVSLGKDAKSAYNKLAQRIGAPVVCKSEPKSSKKPKHQNGVKKLGCENSIGEVHTNGQSQDHNNSLSEEMNSSSKKDKKRKKKMVKQNANHSNDDGIVQNGTNQPMDSEDTLEKEKLEKAKNKRSNLNTSDVPSKKKRKSVQSGD